MCALNFIKNSVTCYATVLFFFHPHNKDYYNFMVNFFIDFVQGIYMIHSRLNGVPFLPSSADPILANVPAYKVRKKIDGSLLI